MIKLNYQQIIQFLPHRHPFLFIDEVCEINYAPGLEKKEIVVPSELLNSEVIGKYSVPAGLDLFQGHFPGNPVLPGVIQIEIMAQNSIFSVFKLFKEPFQEKIEVALVKVNEAKFRKPIRPAQELVIHSKCIKVRYPMLSFDCKILSDGVEMSSAQLLASLLK